MPSIDTGGLQIGDAQGGGDALELAVNEALIGGGFGGAAKRPSTVKAGARAAIAGRYRGVPNGVQDDLTKIPGIDRTVANRLADIGVLTYAQLAMLDKSGVRLLADALGMTPDEIGRNGWVDFARQLMGR